MVIANPLSSSLYNRRTAATNPSESTTTIAVERATLDTKLDIKKKYISTDEASSLRHLEQTKAEKHRLAANKIGTKSSMYTRTIEKSLSIP